MFFAPLPVLDIGVFVVLVLLPSVYLEVSPIFPRRCALKPPIYCHFLLPNWQRPAELDSG